MPKVFTSQTQKIGELGETLACEYLIRESFKIVDRNYYQKIGEIDIIARKDKIIHFIEVKTVSCETGSGIFIFLPYISSYWGINLFYRLSGQ